MDKYSLHQHVMQKYSIIWELYKHCISIGNISFYFLLFCFLQILEKVDSQNHEHTMTY